jgi:hypothetical protein
MFHCRFEMMTNKRWRCLYIWEESSKYLYLPILNTIFLDVNTRPPLGFCKRPHKYLAKEVK